MQADTLAPGLHIGLWPWQYTVEKVPFVVISEGKIGIVEACDGNPLPAGRIVGQAVECDSFQDARAFLENEGQRGPQMLMIPPGTWRVNRLLFTIHELLLRRFLVTLSRMQKHLWKMEVSAARRWVS